MKIVRGILSIMVCLSMMGCYMFSNLFPAGGQKNRTPGAAQGGNEVSAGDLEPVPVEDLSMEGLEPAVVEDITIRGQVILPEGVPWQFSDLTVFTAFGEAPVQPDGSFEVPAVRSPQKTLLVMAVLPSQTAALLGLFYPGRENETLELSAASTARALLLFDPAFLEMPVDQQLYAADLGTGLMGFETLAQSVQTSLAADPLNPLDGDAHPELFSQSAQLALQVLTQMGAWPPPEITTGVSPAPGLAWNIRQPAGTSRLAAPMEPGKQFQTPESKSSSPWIFVEDDPDRNLPRVTVVNDSFAYYQLKISVTDPKTKNKSIWSETDQHPLVIERKHPYSVGYAPDGTLRHASTRDLELGDGVFSFDFELDKKLSTLDLLSSTIQGFLGVNAKTPELKFIYSSLGDSLEMLTQTYTFISSLKGKSMQEAVLEFGIFFNKTWITYLKSVWQYMGEAYKKELKNTWRDLGLKFLTSKFFYMAEAGYAGADIALMLYDLIYVPEKYAEAGIQQNGLYPAVLLQVDPEKVFLKWSRNGDKIIPQKESVELEGSLEFVSKEYDTVKVEVLYPQDLDEFDLDIENAGAEFSSENQITEYSEYTDHSILVLVYSKDDLLLAQKTIPILLRSEEGDKKFYTLLLSFDGGCDSDIPGYSTPSGNRITPLPLVIQGNKVSIRYDKTTGDKNLVAGGAGTYNPETGELSINFSSTYTIKYMGYDEKDNPIQVVGVESFIGTVTAVVTDDINLQYESFEGLARGHVEVFYPSTEMRKSEWYKEKNCSADALKATIFEGFVDAGL